MISVSRLAIRGTLVAVLGAWALAVATPPALAGPITLASELVFDGTASDTDVAQARLGETGSANPYVVYQIRPNGPFGAGPGIIQLQHLNNLGAPLGPAVTLNNQGNASSPDASGDYAVYANDLGGGTSAVVLYDISTGSDFIVHTTNSPIGDVRIAGQSIVWRQIDPANGVIMYDGDFISGGVAPPTTVRGPVPASTVPEVDSRFIVWQEDVSGALPGADSAKVRVQEIGGSSFFVIPDALDDAVDEVDPATWGSLIAFGLVETATGLGDIIVRDVMADTTMTFALGLEDLDTLALTGNYLTFNALDGGGVSQAYILRLSDG